VIPLNTARPHVLTRRLDREVGQPLENRSLRYLDWPRDFLCHRNVIVIVTNRSKTPA
jgi:hypothetical protein